MTSAPNWSRAGRVAGAVDRGSAHARVGDLEALAVGQHHGVRDDVARNDQSGQYTPYADASVGGVVVKNPA